MTNPKPKQKPGPQVLFDEVKLAELRSELAFLRYEWWKIKADEIISIKKEKKDKERPR